MYIYTGIFKANQLFVNVSIYIHILKRCVCIHIYRYSCLYIHNTGSPQLQSQVQIWVLACWSQHRHHVVPPELVIYIYIHLYIYIRYVRACMKFCVYDGSGRCNSVCIYIVISHEYVMVIWKHTYPISYSFMNTYIYTLKRCIYIYINIYIYIIILNVTILYIYNHIHIYIYIHAYLYIYMYM